MQYSKPPLSFEDQADTLLARGLEADRDLLITRLKAVSYYRLSGYLFPYRTQTDSYKPGTKLKHIWRLYTFDRRLRLLVLDAIERIEISLRTNLVYFHTHQYDPFGYASATTLPNLTAKQHQDFLGKISAEKSRSHEIFVRHFKDSYGDKHQHLPLWMAAEIMSFGTVLTMLNGVSKPLQQQISRLYGVPDTVFISWVLALNGIRNLCAHHSRLWNRELGYKMLLPRERKYPQWHTPVPIGNNRIFSILTILNYCLNIVAPQSNWRSRLEELLQEYADVPRTPMGFAENWQESPLWH